MRNTLQKLADPALAPAFVFDVEGTLVDSVALTLRCWEETLRTHGVAIERSCLHEFSGMDGNAMLQQLVPDMTDAQRKTVLQGQGERYRQKYLRQVAAFAGVRETFRDLKAAQRRIALATDCQPDELAHYLAITGIADLVDARACGSDVPHGKPWPDLPALAMRQLGLDHGVMVGDTPYDALAASRAGLIALGVETGGFGRHRLQEAGCAAVLPSVGALRLA